MKQIQRERASTGSPSRSADPDPVIDFPGGNPTLTTPGVARLTAKVNNVPLDLSEARIVWEVEGGEPRFGQTASVARSTIGEARVEAEATLPDGRRVFTASSAYFNDPVNGGAPFNPNDPTVTTVALYHFDQFDANGKLPDSKNNYHLTVNGNVTLADNTTWMQSPSGKVVRFRDVG